jgi:SRSO17 transposase
VGCLIDETGFVKKGTKSAGVAKQYSGTAGRIENCQIGVFLTYASPRGRAFLDRALYLPKEWTGDTARRAAAGIPDEIAFATKPALARAMLERAFDAAVPAAWVTGDSIYGNDSKLRFWLHAQRRPYVLAVARSHMVVRDWQQVRVEDLLPEVPPAAWARLTVAAGSKGPRVCDWALARLPFITEEGYGQWLLVRRSVSDPAEVAFYRVFAPEGTTLETVARVAGTRWVVEESFERAKGDVGLDQYEVRRWDAWHRHVTLCLLAHAYLEVTRAEANAATAAAAAEKGGSMRWITPTAPFH